VQLQLASRRASRSAALAPRYRFLTLGSQTSVKEKPLLQNSKTAPPQASLQTLLFLLRNQTKAAPPNSDGIIARSKAPNPVLLHVCDIISRTCVLKSVARVVLVVLLAISSSHPFPSIHGKSFLCCAATSRLSVQLLQGLKPQG
jgi:hypothetical protein